MTHPLQIGLLGMGGRMGRAILGLAQTDPRVQICGGSYQGTRPDGDVDVFLTQDLSELFIRSDVLIDFSSVSALEAHLALAVETQKPLVTGVTGLRDPQKQALKTASEGTAILAAPNMSLGACLLSEAVRLVASRLEAAYETEIFERHHRHKKDAPSGTALALAEAIQESRPTSPPPSVLSSRLGEDFGEHMVSFVGPCETLTLSHHALGRDAFASGALQGALWLVTQPKGLYTMEDVLGLRAHF